MMTVNKIYKILLKYHGPQGWWPLVDEASLQSVYSGDISFSNNKCFEIAIGAILTQGVSWKNVEKSLALLKHDGLLYPGRMYDIPLEELAMRIRSTGYYNQKAKKLKNFLEWFRQYDFDFNPLLSMELTGLRDELLSINGVGPETADSILLYGMSRKVFVVDAYTKRIFKRIGILSGDENYEEVQSIFHRNFKGDVPEYNEYHALIVAHGKDVCRKKPLCSGCSLSHSCIFFKD